MKRIVSLCVLAVLSLLAGCSGLPNSSQGPTAISAMPGNTQVSLTWSAVNGATSYDVYYANYKNGQIDNPRYVLGVKGTSYTQTGLTNKLPYYFTVAAESQSGESRLSPVASATPTAAGGGGAPTAPAPPTNVTASPGDTKAVVSWTGSKGASSYDVFYATTAAGVTGPGAAEMAGVTATTTTVPGLVDGQIYYFGVEAVSDAGKSKISNIASATPSAGVSVTLKPGTASTATLQANSTTSLTYSFPANAVTEVVEVAIGPVAQSKLPAPLPQPGDTFVAGFAITNNPSSVTAYDAAVGVAGKVDASFSSGQTLTLALLKGNTWTDVATFVVGANGTIVENLPSLTLPGLLAPGNYLLYLPVAGSTTSVSNLGIVLLADDGNIMADGKDGVQVMHIYDKNGALLKTPTISYLDYAGAGDLDGLALTPDGSQGIMVDGGNTVRFFSGAQTGTPVASPTTLDISAYGGDGDSVAILPRGDEAVVSGDGYGVLLLVSGILADKPVAATIIPVPGYRDGLAISNDGKVMLARGNSGTTIFSIASIPPKPGSIGGTVSHSFTQTADLPALAAYSTEDGRDGLAISPTDSSRAVVVGPQDQVQLITGLPSRPVVHPSLALSSFPYSVSVSPDGKMAVIGTADGLQLVSGVDTGNLALVGTLYTPTYTSGATTLTLSTVLTLNITLDNKYVVAADASHRTLLVIPFTSKGFAAGPAAVLGSVASSSNDQLAVH